MISKLTQDFRFGISLRLALILINMIVFAALLLRPDPLVFSLIGLGLLLILQMVLLFRSLQKIYDQMEDFFNSLRHQDTTRRPLPAFSQGRKLAELWQEIQNDMQQLRERNESLLHYYSVLLEKVPVPLLRLQGKQVELINSAARQLFQRSQLQSLQQLADFGENLPSALTALKPGEQQLLSIASNQQTLSLAASATSIHTAAGDSKIISLQVIQRELDQQQVEAWQKLVQVLSHEIMNSMTPICSLSNTAHDLLESYSHECEKELLSDAREAVATLSRRSEHLKDFVSAYRTVAQPLDISTRPLAAQALFDSVTRLFAAISPTNTRFFSQVQPIHLHIQADPIQLEQALINLVKNALEAFSEQDCEKIIRLNAFINPQGQAVIDVIDNGPGVSTEVREQIFVPFYTSKRQGTGVGLFLVQQIMQAHGGSVHFIAQDRGSCFRLTF